VSRRISKFDLIAEVGPYITIKTESTSVGLFVEKKKTTRAMYRENRDRKSEWHHSPCDN